MKISNIGNYLFGFILILYFQNCSDPGKLDIKFSSQEFAATDLELHSSWIDINRLAAYWKLSESSVNHNTALTESTMTIPSTLLTYENSNKSVATKVGSAIYFDGTDDNISVSSTANAQLNFDTRSFTYMLWVKVDSSAGKWDMPIWHGGNIATDAGYDMELGKNVWAAYVSDGTTLFNVEFGNEADFLGRWVHLAVVIDRQTQEMRGYVNGVLKNTTIIASLGSVDSPKSFTLGSDSGGNFFKGTMAEVAIWNAALSENEIKRIFERLGNRFY